MSDNKLQVELTGEARGLFSVIGEAGKAIEGFSTHVSGQFNVLTDVVTKFQKPLVELASLLGGGALFKSAIDQTVEYGKETLQVQRVMGGSREEASALAIAIGKIHGDTEGYLSGVQKLVKTLNSNEEGMHRMGIATRDSSGDLLSMQEIVQNTNKALLEYKEGADRDAASQTVLGKSWESWQLYLAVTPDLLRKAREEGERLGLILGKEGAAKIDAYRDAMHEVSEVFEAVKINVGLELMPKLTELGQWFGQTAPAVIGPVVSLVSGLAQILSYHTVQIGLAILVLKGPLISMLGFASQFGSAMVQIFERIVLGVQGPMTSMASSIMGMINPMTLAVVAIGAVCLALEWYSKTEEQAAAAAQKRRDAEMQGHRDWVQVSQDVVRIESEMNNAATGGERKAVLQERLAISTRKLLELYPTLNSFLRDESGHQRSLAEAIRLANEERERSLRLESEEAEAAVRSLETTAEKRKQWIASDEAESKRLKDSDQGGWAYAYDKRANYNTGELKKDIDLLDRFKKSAQDARNALDLYLASKSEGGDKRWGGKPDSESALQKLKSDLEQEKYQYEQAAADKGQLMQYTKAMEAKWLEENLEDYGLKTKEKAQAEKMLFEAKRAVLKEGHDAEIATMEASLESYKHDAKKRLDIAEDVYLKEAMTHGLESKDAAIAWGKVLKVRQEIADQEKKVLQIQEEAARQHDLAMLSLEEEKVRSLRQLGEISAQQELDALKALEQAKFDMEYEAVQQELNLANLSAEEQEKIWARMAKLRDEHGSRQQGFQSQQQGLDQQNTVSGGIQAYIAETKQGLEQWGNMARTILQGLEGAFANFYTSLFQKGQDFNQKMRALWTGLSQAVVQALSKMAAQETVLWLIQKAKWAWDKMKSGWDTAETSKQVAESATKTTAATTETGANVGRAASETFAAHASIPWVGIAIAVGLIAVMMSLMKSITARAVGGLVQKPELTLLGEAGPEVVAPESTFKDWAGNLSRNIIAQERQALSYQHQAAGYARTMVAGQRDVEGEDPRSRLLFKNCTIISTDTREWEDMVGKGQRRYDERHA